MASPPTGRILGSLSMNERISRSFRLLNISWKVLVSHRELSLLTLISLVSVTAAAAVALGALAWAGGPSSARVALAPIDYAYLVVFYLATYFLAVFFNAAVAAMSMMRLKGEDAAIADGLILSTERLTRIAAWAGVSATVGLILRGLGRRGGFLGRALFGVYGVAWGAVALFVVPVLLTEPVGVGDGVKRSASVFRQRWGEGLIGVGSIGLAMGILTLPLITLAAALAVAWAPAGIAAGLLGISGMVAVGSATSGIYAAALYRYATTGQTAGSFDAYDLEGAFGPRRY